MLLKQHSPFGVIFEQCIRRSCNLIVCAQNENVQSVSLSVCQQLFGENVANRVQMDCTAAVPLRTLTITIHLAERSDFIYANSRF